MSTTVPERFISGGGDLISFADVGAGCSSFAAVRVKTADRAGVRVKNTVKTALAQTNRKSDLFDDLFDKQ